MFGEDWDKEDWTIVILVFAMFAGIIGYKCITHRRFKR